MSNNKKMRLMNGVVKALKIGEQLYFTYNFNRKKMLNTNEDINHLSSMISECSEHVIKIFTDQLDCVRVHLIAKTFKVKNIIKYFITFIDLFLVINKSYNIY
jgi:hypothetical protein